MNKNDEAALVPRTTSALIKTNPGAKRILAGMVAETLALVQAKAAPQRKPTPPIEGTSKFIESAESGHANTFPEQCKGIRDAAEQGDASAQWGIGNFYQRGALGLPIDYVKATTWYRKAAEQGHAISQLYLARYYANGEGVPQDYAQAVRWFRKAAELGDADAQHELGSCYYRGRGASRDYAEAVRWYRSAAEQGHANAQCSLGYCYEHGEGISQHHAEAVKWYRKAAEQGHPIAQDNLGLAYSSRSDVQNDNDRFTFENFIAGVHRSERRIAEESGSAFSQFVLGGSYASYAANNAVPGTGSLNHACAWLRMAAEQGHSEAKEELASLVSLLSPSELAESERLYEQYSKPKSSPI